MKTTFRAALSFTLALVAALAFAGAGAAQPAPQGIVVVPDNPSLDAFISVAKPVYQVGETIQINYGFSGNSQAYVYIIDIDAAGRASLLFPNKCEQNNLLQQGSYTLPGRSGYSLQVVPPTGTEHVQILASAQPLDLRDTQGRPITDHLTGSCSQVSQVFLDLGSAQQFQQQAEAAVQGIAPTPNNPPVASDFTSFQVGGGQPGNRNPVANFTVSPSDPRVGQTVTFDASGSFDPDGFIASYQWDLNGDGFADASGSRVSRSYTSSGQFQVTLTVRDNRGASATSTRTLQVGSTRQPPVASFSFNPSNPQVGQAITFDASGSFDPDGFIVSRDWDFNGDGFTDASGTRVSQAFFSTGQQRVTLTVRDNSGMTATTTQFVQVGGGSQQPTTAGFFVDSPSSNTLRIRVQGQSNWSFQNHPFKILLETDGVFTSVQQQGTGNAAPQGIAPTPNQDTLELNGNVRDGSVTYIIRLSSNVTKVKFDLRLDSDGDGFVERTRSNVFLGGNRSNPPSNPFVLSFGSGGLVFDASLRVCLVLVDQPGIHFSLCFRLGNL